MKHTPGPWKAFEICFWGALCGVMTWATFNAVESGRSETLIVCCAALAGIWFVKFLFACVSR